MKTALVQDQDHPTAEEKDKIIIFIFSPAFGGKKVRVNSLDSVSILFQLLTSQNIDVLYQGNVLNPKSTFFDCGISQGDRVILMNQNQIDFKTETFWKNLSRTESNLKQFVSLEDDPTMKREFARLTDMKLIKCENRRFSFCKLIDHLSFLNKDSFQNSFKSNLNFENKAISTLPLPNPFSE
jgi:hypothetical protein